MDGEPRFAVTEIDGERIRPDGRAQRKNSGMHQNLECYVLDRANCHRIVFRAASGGPRRRMRHFTRRDAERECARLNAEEAQ